MAQKRKPQTIYTRRRHLSNYYSFIISSPKSLPLRALLGELCSLLAATHPMRLNMLFTIKKESPIHKSIHHLLSLRHQTLMHRPEQKKKHTTKNTLAVVAYLDSITRNHSLRYANLDPEDHPPKRTPTLITPLVSIPVSMKARVASIRPSLIAWLSLLSRKRVLLLLSCWVL